jgi:outer membrane protein
MFVFLLTVQVTVAQVSLWTFQQCLDSALDRKCTRINLAQSKANRIPSASANANEGLNFGKNINTTTNTFVIQTFNLTNFGVGSSLTLFNGFQNSRTIQQNSMIIEAGKYDIATIENTVTLNITTAYLQLLFEYEILSAAVSQS